MCGICETEGVEATGGVPTEAAASTKRITWLGVARSPYNDYLFSSLNKVFDLRVFYQFEGTPTHPWQLQSAGYSSTYLTGHFLQALKRAAVSDVVVVSGWAFWQHLVIMLLPLPKAKKIYWTDTINLDRRQWSGRKGNVRRVIATMVFAVCDEVWSTGTPGCRALQRLGCPVKKIRSFPFFLDLSRYSALNEKRHLEAQNFRARHTDADDQVVFLCMGQLASKKRFADAIRALAMLNTRDAMLWIAGSGPQESDLKRLVREEGVVSQVRFLGWLQQSDVELAYLAADVFVHPASFDPYPTVVLDAMTWAKPIVGTKVSGSVEDRVAPNKSGFIYDEGNVDELAGYLKFFLDHRHEISNFGREARQTACSYPVDCAVRILQT